MALDRPHDQSCTWHRQPAARRGHLGSRASRCGRSGHSAARGGISPRFNRRRHGTRRPGSRTSRLQWLQERGSPQNGGVASVRRGAFTCAMLRWWWMNCRAGSFRGRQRVRLALGSSGKNTSLERISLRANTGGTSASQMPGSSSLCTEAHPSRLGTHAVHGQQQAEAAAGIWSACVDTHACTHSGVAGWLMRRVDNNGGTLRARACERGGPESAAAAAARLASSAWARSTRQPCVRRRS